MTLKNQNGLLIYIIIFVTVNIIPNKVVHGNYSTSCQPEVNQLAIKYQSQYTTAVIITVVLDCTGAFTLKRS